MLCFQETSDFLQIFLILFRIVILFRAKNHFQKGNITGAARCRNFIKKILPGEDTGISCTDTTPLRVCRNQRIRMHS